MLIRATIPRIRYDQLMHFGWKVLLPLALANILVTSFLVAVSMIELLFFLFAAVALGSAINVLVQKHVLYSSLSLIVLLTAISALFVLMQAEFLAVINVIVYAGAIMVLFVFVIMLLNLPADEDGVGPPAMAEVPRHSDGTFPLVHGRSNRVECGGDAPERPSLPELPQAIGASLFTDYLLPFELTSLLILIALMGAVVFAKKDL